MLSAIAARKAALQSKGLPTSKPTEEPPSSPSPSPPPEEVKNATKRKPSGPVTPTKSTKKKRKKNHVAKEEKTVRYFDATQSKVSQDAMVIDVGSDEEQDGSDDDVSSDEPSTSFIPSTPAPSSRRRAWSPSTPFDDSADQDEVQNSIRTVPIVSPLSTFQPLLNKNIFHLSTAEIQGITSDAESRGTLVFLNHQDRLALLGVYRVTVVYGSITISGVTLGSSKTPYDIFAPRSSPIPILQCPTNPSATSLSSTSLPARCVEAARGFPAAILLQELNNGVSGLGKICGFFEKDFVHLKWQDDAATSAFSLAGIQNLTRQSSEVYPTIVPDSWSSALSLLDVPHPGSHQAGNEGRPIYLVKGLRKSGKSTFARMLLNRLVTRYRYVAYMECDLGQSEFTPGGMVALNLVSRPVFGPPFSHPSIPYQSHYIGSTSPKSSPSHYLDAIQALIRAYELDVQHAGLTHDNGEDDGRIIDVVPLVVNTMGWTKGLGADISIKIEEFIQPSKIFEFAPLVPEDGHAQEPRRQGVPTTSVQPILSAQTPFTAAEHRQLSILSYFHANFPSPCSPRMVPSPSATSWNVSLPLCAQPPYELEASTALDRIILTGPGAEDVVPTQIGRVLNGAVVGLVSCDPGTLDIDDDVPQDDAEDGSLSVPYTQGMSPPSPSTSNCLGLALVRATSPSSHSDNITLQVVTPVPSSLLASARPRVFVKGEMELPVWGFLDFRSNDGRIAGVNKSQVPYLKWGKGEGIGGEKRRVRRNLMRKGQS
ncbi:hypothetical protein K474DRAFT_1689126 [Panus rudis PR-1116 ss-1]|nr:hypothetical protein K474DRAFT_1689126 [Panus rudis PR-1116 ss-1]